MKTITRSDRVLDWLDFTSPEYPLERRTFWAGFNEVNCDIMLLLRQHTSKSHAARDRYCIICRQFAPHFSQAVETLWGTWYQYCSTDRVLESPYLLLRRFYDFHRMSYWELTTKRSRLPSPRCRAAPHLCPRVSWSPRAGPRSCWEWPPAPGGSWQTVRLASLSCTRPDGRQECDENQKIVNRNVSLDCN